ncbi:S8 family serine peptidase [Lachnoclostridium phytofermentans]|uniref:Peptidase S8 and S53 subtilisin kexin sedolisin n=1 Tax=Lachnoclostridium phytofermentans (strain ATCC 700394 / DSM 18823 / ISDg) TaxID=357809 RepID=A9KS87_LACP7|nr:S8 family serine peptidase [Lachnoclostridium phytofermentans]ABX42119.1 peptidase S8 and S53 subtilisin kexin sedolisin [Lachnoclostridium phytofermentans ISDg]
MKNKSMKRMLSLLVSILMIFGSIWLTPGVASAADIGSQKLQTSEANSAYQEKNLNGMPVVDNKNFTSDKTQITAKLSTEQFNLSDEEVDYVNKLADSLQTPVGAVGFTDLGSTNSQNVIVQFDVLPSRILNIYNKIHNIKGINSEATAAASLSKFKTSLKNSGISVKFGYEFHDVFNGVAVTMPANMIEKVAKLPGVYSVSPDYMMYAADDSNGYVNFNGVGMQESREVLRSAELNDMGFDGKGIKVGVLDTGIDYNHPDLKDNYRGGHDYVGGAVAKVDSSGNVSFIVPVSEDNDPMETTYKDWQAAAAANGTTLCPEVSAKGSEYYTSHGSHVSGTVAADGQNTSSPFNTLGIAPKADLYVYRVLGPYGSGPSSGIIAAINQSVIDGMQVINLSLGANQNTAYGADVIALNNACIAGTIVCVSAGNNAEPNNTPPRLGLSLGTPGTAYLPITVAASNYGGGATTFYMDAVANSSANVTASVPFNVVGRDVTNVFADNQITAANLNYVDGLGYQYTLVVGPMTGKLPGPTQLVQLQALADNSLKGQILVVKRGSLTFTDLPPQAKRLGAGAILIIDKDAEEGFISGITIGGEKINHLPVLSTTHQAGDALAASYNAAVVSSVPAYIRIGNMSKVQLDKTPASFSSIGPVTETAGIKPDIIAPGVDIMSTQPAFITNADHNSIDYSYAYARMNGTSMSCPHMTGISVLMRQAFPNASVAEIKARLMNTADPTLITSGVPATPQASVFEVGAGFVNPYRAIVTDTSTYVTVQDDIPGQKSGEILVNQTLSSLSFGTIKPSSTTTVNSRILPVTVHNTSVNEQTYYITGVYNDHTGYSRSSVDGVTISCTSTDVTVPAGQTGTFEVYTTVPVNCPKGYYEGYVHVTSNSGNDYVLPFAFATGDAPKPFIIDDAWIIKPVITANTNTNIRCTTYSNTTPFALAYEGDYPGGAMDILLLDLNDTPIGYFGTYSGMGKGDGTAKLYMNAITYQCYPIDKDGNIGTKQNIPEGAYHIAFADSDYYYPFGGLVVDNQRPVLTFNPTPNYEYSNGATTVHITGRIWSHAGQLLVDNKITSDNLAGSPLIGQELNGLIIGSTIYQYCDKDGYFDIPLNPSTASKTGIQTSTAYAQDYYAITYYSLLGSVVSTKTGNNRTNGTVNFNYTQSPVLSAVAATNSTAEVKLSYNPRLIAPVADDFKVQYSVNGGAFTDLMTTSFNYTAATAIANFTFAPFPVISEEQRIVVSVSYKGGTAVEAAGVVVPAAKLVGLTGDNGSLIATLDMVPTDGTAYPFEVSYTINGGDRQLLGNATYQNDGTATFNFTPFEKSSIAQNIVVYVNYKDTELSYSFGLTVGMGTLVLNYNLYQNKSISANEFTTSGMKFFQTGNFFECTKINVAEAKTEYGYHGLLMAGPHSDQVGTFTAKIDEQNNLTFTYYLYDGLKTTDTVTFVYSSTLFTSKNQGQLYKDYANTIQIQEKGASTGTFIVNNVTGTEFYVYLRSANSSGTTKVLAPPDPNKVITLQLTNDLTPQTLSFTYGSTLTQVIPAGTYMLEGYGTVVVTLDGVTYVEYNVK